MKKLCSVLLSMTLLFSFAACSNGASAASRDDSAEAPDASEETVNSRKSAKADDPAQEGGTLIAYFSWSGNTEKMAQTIQEEIGGDLFQIEPAVPYTDDYDALLDIAQQEQADNARPELAAQVENWDSYEAVFVGFPNWWSDAPMAVYTFLESYDFSGKTLIPFNTSASGGFGRSLSGIEESAAGADILEGLALTEEELENVQSEVSGWLSGLSLE